MVASVLYYIIPIFDHHPHALPSIQDDVTKQRDGEFGKPTKKKSTKKRDN
jgi:hypothetical protein